MQKTCWHSRTSCRKFWWFDYTRSQSSQWRVWISKQSSICSRGARLGYPVDPGVSVPNKNFTRNPEKLAKVPGTREETKSHLHWQFLGIWQGLWRSFLESLYVDTPHRSQTNGIAERAVRKVKEGTSAVLLQSGLYEKWLADSLECYTYLRNIQDLLSDGKTPLERRFWEPFNGPLVPFGSLVDYYPISAKDQSRIHQFGKKVLPGLFLGYALYAGGIWKGDILVADLEELETMDASEIYAKRFNAKEVIFPKEHGKFIFPVADGRIKFVGGEQELRTSTLIQDHPIRGEDQRDFLGESEGSPPPLPQDSLPDAGEARTIFGPCREASYTAITLNPESNFTRREKSHSLFHWSTLTYPELTRTNLDVKQEKRINDYWNIDGSRDLSDSWTGFTQFTLLEEKAPDGYMWSGERLTKRKVTSRIYGQSSG